MTQEQKIFTEAFSAIFTNDFIKQVWADMHEMTSEYSKFEGNKLYYFEKEECPQIRLAKWDDTEVRRNVVPVIEAYFPSRVSRITGKSIPAQWLPALLRPFRVAESGAVYGNWKTDVLQDVAKLARLVAIGALDNDILGVHNGTIRDIPSLKRHKF